MEKLPNLQNVKIRKLNARAPSNVLGHYDIDTFPLRLDRLDQFRRLTTLEVAQLTDPEVGGLVGVTRRSQCLQSLHLTAASKSRVAIINGKFDLTHGLQPMSYFMNAMYDTGVQSDPNFPPCPQPLVLLRPGFPSSLRSLTLLDSTR